MPNSEDHAIVVGISDYAAFDELKQLKAAIGDAVAFADWLRSPDGGDIPPDQVHVIVRSPDRKDAFPVKDDIDNTLSSIIAGRKTRIGRRFYFYFSGHGCSPSADDLLLFLANTNKGMLLRNVGAAPYTKFLQDPALFDELVFVLDCCRDYQEAQAQAQPPYLTPIPKSDRSVNVRPFTALGTGYGQSSFAPDDEKERSFFTKFLIEGLTNARNADGSVTAQSLNRYVTEKVAAEAVKYGFTQIPEIPTKHDIVFRPAIEGQTLGGRLLSFTIPTAWTRPLELQDGSFNKVREVAGTDGKFQAVLSPGLYEIVYPADAGPADNVVRLTLRVNPAVAPARVKLEADKDKYNV